MKLFVIIYGLYALVPQDKGVTALLLDSRNLKYFDGVEAPVHTARVVYLTPDFNDSRPAGGSLELAGEDLIVDLAADEKAPSQVTMIPAAWDRMDGTKVRSEVERTFIHARRLTGTDDEARVKPACLARSNRDCSQLLNGRVVATGALTMFPIEAWLDDSHQWTGPDSLPRHVWAFRDPVNKRRSGTYEGEFSQSIGLAGDVSPTPTTTISLLIGHEVKELVLAASTEEACKPYLKAINDPSAGSATCFLVKVSNFDEMSDEHERSHLPLLDHLAVQRTSRPLEVYRRQTVLSPGVGNPHSDPCAGKIMLPWP